jgi:putative Holliday junction resolvase
MRFLGVDLGRRRIGLAVSDGSATLARPWRTVEAASTPAGSAARVLDAAAECLRELDEPSLAGIIVGLPRRLNGDDTDQTAAARAFAVALSAANAPPVHLQDERLSSHEAERLLAQREPDWRLRKQKLDAAAAAVILQDFLDGRAGATAVEREGN